MATLYCRMKKLTNVYGRRCYISDKKRQEYLEGFYDTMSAKDWVALGSENRAQFESMKRKGIMAGLKNAKGDDAKCIEARELIIHMPHGMALKNQNELARQIAELIKSEYGVDCCVALHWNKAKSNYHAHIIISEKNRLTEPMRATRNMYYDENWKRCKKTEAVHVVKKGDVIRTFESSKLKKFKTHDFLEKELKPLLAKEVNLEVYKDDGIHLTFQKVGKTSGELRNRILTANDKIRDWNKAMDYLLQNGASKDELERFRYICFNNSKKEWREGLTDGFNMLKNTYCINDNEFIKLWNIYLRVQNQSTYYLPKELEQELATKKSVERKIEDERSVFFFKRDRKKIDVLERKLEGLNIRIDQLNDYINIAPKQLNNSLEKLRRSKRNFMECIERYYSAKYMPEYDVAKSYYDLQKYKQIKRENDKNRELPEYMLVREESKTSLKTKGKEWER